MVADPFDRKSSIHSSGTLLRFRRQADHFEEIYVARGLTIGRTPANTIVLPDDELYRPDSCPRRPG